MEEVSEFSIPKHPTKYVTREILKKDGSFLPNLHRVYRIAWIAAGPIVEQGLFTERFSEIIELGHKKGCEFRTWESQGGAIASVVKDRYQDLLQKDYEIWCQDLKRESENKHRKKA